MIEVRKATRADIPEVAEALARSFHDDPVMAYVVPENNRASRLRRLFEIELKFLALPHDESYTTVGPIMGAALWAPPGKWKPPFTTLVRTAPSFLRILGTRIRPGMKLMSLVEKNHPKEPHYYLSTLGTEPDFQRKGVGSAVMKPVLDRCDEQGIPAYLESSKEVNVPYYRRHGFEVTSEVSPPNGPTLWLMWREPQSSTTR